MHKNRIGPAMPYSMAESYTPEEPGEKASRFSGRRYITGKPRRLTVAEMREGVLRDYPDATDFRKAGHSKCTFRVGPDVVFRYHATDVAVLHALSRRLTLSAFQGGGGEHEKGWHTPSTRNAWMDAIPALLGAGWACNACGAGHNASSVRIYGPGGVVSVTVKGRAAVTVDLPEGES